MCKNFNLFQYKNLFFLFCITTFQKHQRQIIYSIVYFIQILFLHLIFLSNHPFHSNLYSKGTTPSPTHKPTHMQTQIFKPNKKHHKQNPNCRHHPQPPCHHHKPLYYITTQHQFHPNHHQKPLQLPLDKTPLPSTQATRKNLSICPQIST